MTAPVTALRFPVPLPVEGWPKPEVIKFGEAPNVDVDDEPETPKGCKLPKSFAVPNIEGGGEDPKEA